MSTPTQSQILATDILKQIRKIVTELPHDPEALRVNKAETSTNSLLAMQSIDIDLGGGRSVTLSLWERMP